MMSEKDIIRAMARKQPIVQQRATAAGLRSRRWKPAVKEGEITSTALTMPEEFKGSYVQLSSGEWVRNEDYRNLTDEQKSQLSELGIDKFIELSEEKRAEFEANYVKVGEEEWVVKDIYEGLSDEDKTKLSELGVEKFNEYSVAKATTEAEAEMVSKGYIKVGEDEWIDKGEFDKLTKEEQEKLVELGVSGFNEWRQGKYEEEVQKAQSEYESKVAEYEAKVAAVTPKVVPLTSGSGAWKGYTGEYFIRTKFGDMPAWMMIEDTKGAWLWSGASIYDRNYNRQNVRYAWQYPQRYEITGWTQTGNPVPIYKYYNEPWTEELWLKQIGATKEDAKYYQEKYVGVGLKQSEIAGLYDKDGTYIDPVTGDEIKAEGYVDPYGLYDSSGKKIRGVTTTGYTVEYHGGRWPTSVTAATMPSGLNSTGIVQKWPEQVATFAPEIKFPGQWPTAVSSPAVLALELGAEELEKQIARGEIIRAKDGNLIPLKVSEEDRTRGVVGFSDLTKDEQYKVRTEGTKGIVEYTIAGEPVATAYLDKLPEDTKKILIEQGLGAYEYAKVIGGLGEYKSPEGQYNINEIVKDIEDGKLDITESQLAMIFESGKEVISQAKQYIVSERALALYEQVDPQTGEKMLDVVSAIEDARHDEVLRKHIEAMFEPSVIKKFDEYVDAKIAIESKYLDPKSDKIKIRDAVRDSKDSEILKSQIILLFGDVEYITEKRMVDYEDTLRGFNISGQDLSYKNSKTGEVIGYDIVSAMRSKDPQIKEAIRAIYPADGIAEAIKGKIIEPSGPVEQFNMWVDEVTIKAERDATKGLIYVKDPEAKSIVIQTKPIGQMTPDEWFDYASSRFNALSYMDRMTQMSRFGHDINFTAEEKKLFAEGSLNMLKELVKELPDIVNPNEYANFTQDKYYDKAVLDRIDKTWNALPEEDKARLFSALLPAPDTWQRKVSDTVRLEEVIKGITAPVTGTFAPLEDPLWINDLRLRPVNDPERQAYVKQWQQDAITTGAFVASLSAGGIWSATGAAAKALTPAFVYRLPLGKFVANAAIHLAQVSFAGAPLLRTGSTISEAIQATNIDRKWDVFQMQPVGTQDMWARKAGYDKSFDELNEAQKGHVLLTYSTPDGLSNEEWIQIMSEKMEKMQEYANKGADWLIGRVPHPILAWPVQALEGAVVGTIEGVGYTAMLPMLATEVVNKVPEGTADDMAKQLAAQMTAFATFVIPEAFKQRPALTAGRVFGLLVLAPKAAVKLFGAKLAGVSEGHVPKRAMVLEWETFRVEGKRLPTVEDMKQLSNKIVEELITSGKPEIEVTIDGVVGARIRNVPWQQVVGKSMFHGSPESLKTNPDGSVTIKTGEPLYTSPHLAERTLLETYSGMRGKHPTVNVILNAESFKPQLQKTLGGKMIEPEHPYGFAEDIILDPVPGMNGKGVTGSAYTGMAAIRYWTIRGTGVEWKGLTDIQHAQLKALAAKESLLDFFLGWNGRRRVWKQMFGKDPKVEKLDGAIKEWKNRVPETTKTGDHSGELTRLRTPVSHPNGGEMRTTIGTAAITPDGKFVFTRARFHETVPTVAGGGVHYIGDGVPRGGAGVEFKQPGGISETYGRTYKSSAGQSFKEELGLTGDLEYLGKYGGKRNEYSLPGSHVYVMKMKPGQTIDTYRYNWDGVRRLPKDHPSIKPEIEYVSYWDGKTEMTVSPSAYDIAQAVNIKYKMGWDMSKLKVKTELGSDHVAKVRDKGFADRVAKNKELTEAELKRFEDLETQWLESARDRLLKGNPVGFKDWLMAETQLGALEELIMGRRKAVSYFNELKGKKLAPQEIVNTINQLKQQGISSPVIEGILEKKVPSGVKVVEDFISGETKVVVEKPVIKIPEVAPKVEGRVEPIRKASSVEAKLAEMESRVATINEKVMRGDKLTSAEEGIAKEYTKVKNELVDLNPKEAAQLSKEGFEKWEHNRAGESYRDSKLDRTQAEQLHEAYLEKGDFVKAEAVRNRISGGELIDRGIKGKERWVEFKENIQLLERLTERAKEVQQSTVSNVRIAELEGKVLRGERLTISEAKESARLNTERLAQASPKVGEVKSLEPITHRGTDVEAIKVGEQHGLSFDGMQEGARAGEPSAYQFTVQRGVPEAKGITFYVDKLSEVPTRLSEKLTEFGIKSEMEIMRADTATNKTTLTTFKDMLEIPIENKATLIREMTADGKETLGFKLRVNEGEVVYVNGKKVIGTVEINYGDYIRVGDTGVAFRPKEGSLGYWDRVAKEFTPEEIDTITKELNKMTEKQVTENQSTLDRLADEYYYENARFYQDRYVNYLDKFSRAAIGQFRDSEKYFDDKDTIQEEYEKMYDEERLGQVRPFRTEGAIPWDGRLDTTRKESPSRAISYLPSEVTRYVEPQRIEEVVGVARIGARDATRREGVVRTYPPREGIVRGEEVYTKPRIGIEPERPVAPPYEPPSAPVVPPEIPLKPPLIPPNIEHTREYIEKYGMPAGSAAWKQGWVYRHWFPPFGKDDWLFTKAPIREVHYATGPKSAFESIVAIGGPLPDKPLEYDMGLQKLKIVPNVKGTDPGIYFELDREDASWSPEKVAEREMEEAREERIQEREKPEPKVIKQQIVEQPEEEVEEIEETEMPIETQPLKGTQRYEVVEEPEMAQPQAETQPQRIIPQKREIVREAKISEEESGFSEATPMESSATGFEDKSPMESDKSPMESDKSGFEDESPFDTIGVSEQTQVEEVEEPNVIPVNRNWGENPAYNPQKPKKRVAKQSGEEQIGIVRAR